jgi:creatinine amidohydrolase/Fe(II)-dependent formamide hydrolase-like protein
MRYLRDDLVDMSAAAPVDGEGKKLFFAYLIRKITPTGTLGDPSRSTRESGERIYNLAVAGLAEQLRAAQSEIPPVQ